MEKRSFGKNEGSGSTVPTTWYTENSGIGSRLLDTRYDFKYLNSSMNMSHRNCAV